MNELPDPPQPQRGFSAWRNKYKTYEPLAFFFVGFLFDVFTLRRIDDWLKLFFQILFLVLVGLFLIRDYKWSLAPWEPKKAFRKIWEYELEIVHFLFGSLLSAFVIFYFKSASLSRSLIFLLFLGVLLVLNESRRFRAQGLALRICLYSFCLSSFLIYFLPLLAGYLSTFLFISALVVSSLIFAMFIHILYRVSIDKEHYVQKVLPKHVLPAVFVTVFLFSAYFLKLIPPVPLSLTFGGIYHNVEKIDGKIKLSSMKPWYRFWTHGDSPFYARPTDKIFCFVRIFAPARFSHRIYLHWLLHNLKTNSYETQDRIEIPVVGGREEGFRGYSFKTNYQSGQWRINVETEDQREIGSIDFDVVPDESTEERIWKIDEG